MLPANPRLGFLGFGEVGYHFASGFREDGIRSMTAYSKDPVDPGMSPPYSQAYRERARGVGVEMAMSLEELAQKSDLIISAVHGKVAAEVARQISQYLNRQKMFVDVNNSSPHSKEEAAKAVNSAGASFAGVMIMGGPRVEKHKVFMYASGDGAAEFKKVMSAYGMNIHVVEGGPGAAGMIKTLWEVVTKGYQAIWWEILLAMDKAGLDPKKYPYPPARVGKEWIHFTISDELTCHAGIHAARKSGELEEVAETLRELGIDPIVTEAASKRLAKVAEFKLKELFKGEIPEGGPREMIDLLKKKEVRLS